ncbi:DUF4169 family protein [Sphingomonas sp. ID0503]|jgi:hypothetical protein|uniref:DUF4169 family protein n=1 Tax=Sphingomonas sp. ID0503 TaxID=3399691 RepID=UPI003AFB3B65
MAEIVNLRQARKAKARSAKEVEAQANRALHGRTKAEKARDEAERARLTGAVDQAQRETGG